MPRRLASLLFAAVFLLPFSAARARIGETVAQVEQRYGQPVGEPPRKLATHYASAEAVRPYHKSGLVICVAYLHGKSVAEFFVHGNGLPLTGPEMDDLLAANRGEANLAWKRLDLGETTDGATGWARSDGLLVASGNTERQFLEILDRPFWDTVTQAEAHPLEGF